MAFAYILCTPLAGAKLIALLDPEKSDHAVKVLCNWDSSYSGVDINVSYI